jgi:hypothetical protein
MKFGINQVLIRQGSGRAGCYGIYQKQVQVIKIFKKGLYLISVNNIMNVNITGIYDNSRQ